MTVANKVENVVIIGSGPAGCTAAVYCARANLEPVLITGKIEGGQLIQTHDIQNWPGIESISGFELMNNLLNHAKNLGTRTNSDTISSIVKNGDVFELQGENNKYLAKSVIIATGSSPRKLTIESEDKFLNKGVSFCATCDGFFYRKQDVAIVGGGNTALSEALYLSNLCNKVYLIHRREDFRAEKILIEKVKEQVELGKIELVLNATVNEIIGDDLQGVEKLELLNTKDNSKFYIDVKGVFVAIGHNPNTTEFSSLVEVDGGIIKTNINPKYTTATSVLGVFAAGDCSSTTYRQAITSAGSGCTAALDVERYLKEDAK
jgi:thioredoxin reductase (NADPH)